MACALQIVFFDAANTVIEPVPSVGHIYARVAAKYGVEASAESLNKAFPSAWKGVRGEGGASPYGTTEESARRFWFDTVRRTFEEAGHRMPDGTFFDELYRVFELGENWRVAPDLPEALELVRRAGIRTGILSNFDGRLRKILAALGLDESFEVMAVSCEIGAEKPDRAIFDAARELAGVKMPSEVGFIGDQKGDDLEGARAAGWRACRIDRSLSGPDAPNSAFPTLTSCVEYLLQ